MSKTVICICFTVACLIAIVTVVSITASKSKTKDIPFCIPCKYDENGVLMVDVEIDKQWIKAVVDTGSSHCLVGNKNCQQCDTLQGSIRPKDPATEFDSLVRYGSQEDIVNWHTGNVRLGQNGKIKSNIEFAVASRRTGSSNYNIFGIGRVPTADTGHLPFIEQYVDGDCLITIDLNKDDATLCIGGEIWQHPPVQTLITMLPSPYFRIPIHSFGFGANSTCKKNILPQEGVIFDTGSNMLDLPIELYNWIYPSLQQNKNIVFTFIDINNKVVKVEYSSNQYRWHSGELLIEKSTDPDHIVIGSLFMKSMRVQFDSKRNLMGFAMI